MLTHNHTLPVIDVIFQNHLKTSTRAGRALLDSGANANFIHPAMLGECKDFNYKLMHTNTRLSLALNMASIEDSTKSQEDVVNSSSSSSSNCRVVVNKNILANKISSEDATLRLLINHLNTDTKSGTTPTTVSLDTKVTIHLSIESTMGNTIAIICDAYVANIRYPLILGYPTLRQHDIFRRLPNIWSPGHQLGDTEQRRFVGDAERQAQPRDSVKPGSILANTCTQDCGQLTSTPSGHVRNPQGESATSGKERVVESQPWVAVRHEVIGSLSDSVDELDSERAMYLCSVCATENDALHNVDGKVLAHDEFCNAVLDEKPEQVFLAHLYENDSNQMRMDVSVNNMTIGTQSSSDTRQHNFTSRPVRDWEDIEDIDDDRLDAIPAELLGQSKPDNRRMADRVDIRGPPSLKAKLRELVQEFDDIFSGSVNPKPANIEPFRMKVNKQLWQIPANGSGIRRMDKTRQDALKLQIEEMLKLGVIRESRAGYYSHGFLVPKKNNKWRLVIDYKNLNKATERVGWPIPNIQDLLANIGEQKSKYFGVMDLTSGYHQAPIHESCIPFTAFLTPFGLYEWVRLAMGLAGAPSYFQRVMSTEVLAGLHAIICFLYLDDLIVTGKSEEEYLANMRRIFLRLREKGITLNPEKCVLGAEEVEYVGHTLNKDGLHFERSKLDSILTWEKPSTQKQLKQFLGVVNWFRGHCANLSTITQPLNAMLTNYSKAQRLQWSADTTAAFEKTKLVVHECPQLFFLDDVSPIIMETDASQYGIGAHLYQQTKERGNRSIAYLSKAFDARMMRWDTAQKEGYAIYYALIKWEHLLRDRFFTILTDHRNLGYLRDTYGHQGKVQRWFACFQSFDYKLLHLAGDKNAVADGLSRCCSPPEGPDKIILAHILAISEVTVEKEKWDTIATVHNATTGHFGVQRTMQRLIRLGHQWAQMREHIRKFIHFCPACQKMSHLRPLIHARAFTISAYRPMERIAIDYIHKLNKDQNGKEHILVVIDCFTRFVELYPTSALTAEETADHLLDYIGRYGTPIQILSDNGSHFVNGTVTSLLHYLGVDHQFSIAYSKEENGIVERANKEVMRHLRNIMFDNGALDQWSRYLPIVQNIMNSAIHSATGFSPAQMIFGTINNMSQGLIFPRNIAPPTRFATTDYVSELFKSQRRLIEAAAESLRKRDKQHLSQKTNNHQLYGPITSFEVDQFVLVEYPNIMRTGPENKLLPTLKGPAKIIRKSDESRYTVEDLVTRRAKDYHVSALRPYNMDLELQKAPLFYAIRDHSNHYMVDKITAHKGKPSSKTKLSFQVHWIGYEEPTWEPWKQVARTLALYQYLKNHPDPAMQKITPNLEIEDIVLDDQNIDNSIENGVDPATISTNDYLTDIPLEF